MNRTTRTYAQGVEQGYIEGVEATIRILRDSATKARASSPHTIQSINDLIFDLANILETKLRNPLHELYNAVSAPSSAPPAHRLDDDDVLPGVPPKILP